MGDPRGRDKPGTDDGAALGREIDDLGQGAISAAPDGNAEGRRLSPGQDVCIIVRERNARHVHLENRGWEVELEGRGVVPPAPQDNVAVNQDRDGRAEPDGQACQARSSGECAGLGPPLRAPHQRCVGRRRDKPHVGGAGERKHAMGVARQGPDRGAVGVVDRQAPVLPSHHHVPRCCMGQRSRPRRVGRRRLGIPVPQDVEEDHPARLVGQRKGRPRRCKRCSCKRNPRHAGRRQGVPHHRQQPVCLDRGLGIPNPSMLVASQRHSVHHDPKQR